MQYLQFVEVGRKRSRRQAEEPDLQTLRHLRSHAAPGAVVRPAKLNCRQRTFALPGIRQASERLCLRGGKLRLLAHRPNETNETLIELRDAGKKKKDALINP